jgi:hypothetical protein
MHSSIQVAISAICRFTATSRTRTSSHSFHGRAGTFDHGREGVRPLSITHYGPKTMTILQILGVLLIIVWLILWLALKLTFVAIHALVVLGVILIIVAFVAGRSAGSKS